LAQFDQARGRVVKELALGHRAEAGESAILCGKEGEVAGYPQQDRGCLFARKSSIND
jgi:hypothetical protein